MNRLTPVPEVDPTNEQIDRLRAFGQSAGRTPQIRKQRSFDRGLIVEFEYRKLALIRADGSVQWDESI